MNSFSHLEMFDLFFQLCIAYKDIAELTKEQTTRALARSIKLRTVNTEEYLFASYVSREEIFTTVYRLWQNALLEKVIDDSLFNLNASLCIAR
jgi:hypothetical protein